MLAHQLDGPLLVLPQHLPTTLADFFDRLSLSSFLLSRFLTIVRFEGPVSLPAFGIHRFDSGPVALVINVLLLGPRPEIHRLLGPLPHFSRGDRAQHVDLGLLLNGLLIRQVHSEMILLPELVDELLLPLEGGGDPRNLVEHPHDLCSFKEAGERLRPGPKYSPLFAR